MRSYLILLLLFVLYTDLEYLVRYLESDRRIILSRTLRPSGGYWPHLYVILRSRSVIRGRGCCGDGAGWDGPSDHLVCWSHLTLFPHADQVEDGGEAAGDQEVTVHHWNSFKWLAQWNISVVGLQVYNIETSRNVKSAGENQAVFNVSISRSGF